MGRAHPRPQHRASDSHRTCVNEDVSADDGIVIIGASHAGVEIAVSLRQRHYAGPITLISDEPSLPYHRPPLSKAYLAATGGKPQWLRPEATYTAARIDLVLGVAAVRIDRAHKRIELANGRIIAYRKLALATGARIRRLPATLFDALHPNNLHYLRSEADALALRGQLVAGRRLVVVGAGYVGLEVAASAAKAGLKVTVLEAMPRVLARVTGSLMSSFYEEVHQSRGVVIKKDVIVEGFKFNDDGGDVAAVRYKHQASGEVIDVPCDLVVVGIGVTPNVELAKDAGLRVDDGIVVDVTALTSDADIVAAGDCTRHPNVIVGRQLRLESVQNAVEQARVAAATLLGIDASYRAVPWFWSDQYDMKLQMAGLSDGHDQTVLRGTKESGSFAVFYLKAGRLIAIDAVNRPKEFMACRRLIGLDVDIDCKALADSDVDLAQLAAPRESTVDV